MVMFGLMIALAIFWIISMRSSMKEFIVSYIVGLIFGIGLSVSGMCQVTKILGFVTISSNWDPTLAFVMIGALAVNFLSFRWIMGRGP